MLHLMVEIGGERVALPADKVEAVVELGPITPVPRVAPHILGLVALRSRVLTVIDSRAAIGLPPAGAVCEAVVVEVDGYAYGLTVDAVEDVAEADGPTEALRGPLAAGWAAVVHGLVPHGGAPALGIDPAALVRAR